uniref:BTB domain-containing protein n=2 Tax=Triticum urartu TaxID=4572 RepID=A0A8R7R9L7_TRIUA
MAEFFGDMKEKCSQCVEIKDMDAEVFKALLQFIYTDTMPELRQREWDAEDEAEYEQQEEADAKAVTVMAQHLLAAADRCGLDRLKHICAGKLSSSINVDTAATTLALAEQHNCPELKTRCVQFIIRTPATLDAVLATEGYKHLEASCPLVVIDLLKAAHGRK